MICAFFTPLLSGCRHLDKQSKQSTPLEKSLVLFLIIQMHLYIYKEIHHITFKIYIFLLQNSAKKTKKKNVHRLLLLLSISRISTLSKMFNEIQGSQLASMLNSSLQHCKFYILIWHNRENVTCFMFIYC